MGIVMLIIGIGWLCDRALSLLPAITAQFIIISLRGPLSVNQDDDDRPMVNRKRDRGEFLRLYNVTSGYITIFLVV